MFIRILCDVPVFKSSLTQNYSVALLCCLIAQIIQAIKLEAEKYGVI